MAQPQVSINNEQRLFVIPCGSGFTCFGFDNCYRDSVAMAQMMNVEPPDALSIGTMACYNAYQALCSAFAKHHASKGTWFTPGTNDMVKSILNRAIESHKASYRTGQVLRLFIGDIATGRDWCNEWDVVGFIGRSTGSQKIPLLLEPLLEGDRRGYSVRSASGGGAILTDCILRIIDVNTRKELYRAANYQVPEFVITEERQFKDLPFLATRDGQEQARFASYGEACEYVAFMTGVVPAKVYLTVEEHEASFAD